MSYEVIDICLVQRSVCSHALQLFKNYFGVEIPQMLFIIVRSKADTQKS